MSLSKNFALVFVVLCVDLGPCDPRVSKFRRRILGRTVVEYRQVELAGLAEVAVGQQPCEIGAMGLAKQTAGLLGVRWDPANIENKFLQSTLSYLLELGEPCTPFCVVCVVHKGEFLDLAQYPLSLRNGPGFEWGIRSFRTAVSCDLAERLQMQGASSKNLKHVSYQTSTESDDD